MSLYPNNKYYKNIFSKIMAYFKNEFLPKNFHIFICYQIFLRKNKNLVSLDFSNGRYTYLGGFVYDRVCLPLADTCKLARSQARF